MQHLIYPHKAYRTNHQVYLLAHKHVSPLSLWQNSTQQTACNLHLHMLLSHFLPHRHFTSSSGGNRMQVLYWK